MAASKNAILVVSFGTSYADTREKTIGAIENRIREAFPLWRVERAFTSGMVIRSILKKEGVSVEDVPSALKRLAEEGVDNLVVQPTHLMTGKEYEKMCAQVEPFRGSFSQIRIGRPLLADEADVAALAGVLEQIYCEDPESRSAASPNGTAAEAVLLMGHGTDVCSDGVYARLQEKLQGKEYNRILIGTVEGAVTLSDVMEQIRPKEVHRLRIAPLMVVAGDHAVNDMAGDSPDSWKSVLERAGYEVIPLLKGLGEYPQIQELYVRHVQDVL